MFLLRRDGRCRPLWQASSDGLSLARQNGVPEKLKRIGQTVRHGRPARHRSAWQGYGIIRAESPDGESALYSQHDTRSGMKAGASKHYCCFGHPPDAAKGFRRPWNHSSKGSEQCWQAPMVMPNLSPWRQEKYCSMTIKSARRRSHSILKEHEG